MKYVLLLLITILTTSDALGAPKRRPIDAGPDLPYSCTVIRWAASIYTEAELEALRIYHGIPKLTPKQRKQVKACLNGV